MKCPECGPTLERLPWLERYARVTKRLAEAVARLSQVLPITRVAKFCAPGVRDGQGDPQVVAAEELGASGPVGGAGELMDAAKRVLIKPTKPKRFTVFPTRKAHSTWARLIAQVYEVDPRLCPRCSAPMRWSSLRELLGRWRVGAICTSFCGDHRTGGGPEGSWQPSVA